MEQQAACGDVDVPLRCRETDDVSARRKSTFVSPLYPPACFYYHSPEILPLFKIAGKEHRLLPVFI